MDTVMELPQPITENEVLTSSLRLTAKQHKFLASYQLTHNSTESAINAGYSVKTAPQAGCRMLKNPKIVNGLKQWAVNKRKEITKEDFVDLALKDYGELDITEPNKPRFLDIAGKTLGYIGTNQQSSSVTNNIQINGDVKIMQVNDKWSALRSLMENE